VVNVKDPEKRRIYMQEYNQRPEVKAKQKEHYQKHKQQIKEYQNRPEIKEKNRIWRKQYYQLHKKYRNDYNKSYSANVKTEVFKHYSPELKCQKCGFNDLRALSIDHINGGGRKHRKEIGGQGNLYTWLVKNNYPNGFQVLCMNCQFIKRIENCETGRVKKSEV
jgi:hypothetical protein